MPRVQKKSSPPADGEDSFEGFPNYGLGDELVVVVVEVLVPGDEPVFTVVLDSVEVPPAGDDLSITVVFSVFFSAGGLVTVVSFCSQAARKAMLMRMQMYLIISGIRSARSDCVSRESLRAN